MKIWVKIQCKDSMQGLKKICGYSMQRKKMKCIELFEKKFFLENKNTNKTSFFAKNEQRISSDYSYLRIERNHCKELKKFLWKYM